MPSKLAITGVGREKPAGVQTQRLLAIVRDDEVCRRLMTTPGVGPVVALTYRASMYQPGSENPSQSGRCLG
jgi:hypothetical protein